MARMRALLVASQAGSKNLKEFLRNFNFPLSNNRFQLSLTKNEFCPDAPGGLGKAGSEGKEATERVRGLHGELAGWPGQLSSKFGAVRRVISTFVKTCPPRVASGPVKAVSCDTVDFFGLVRGRECLIFDRATQMRCLDDGSNAPSKTAKTEFGKINFPLRWRQLKLGLW